MRTPIVNANVVRWRTIEGIDFQQIAPYTLVAKPDRMRALWVWLRKERGASTWQAYVGAPGAPLRAPIASDRSATGALAVAMGLPVWSKPVRFVPTNPVPVPQWSYPEGGSYKRSPGHYKDRPTAHDASWDLPAARYRR
jgi:hypothetical protein